MKLLNLRKIENKCGFTSYHFSIFSTENELFKENKEKGESGEIGSALSFFEL